MLKLRLNDIKKTYNNGESVVALKGISLDFKESEFVSILGQSGCGKTTLLNIIGGLDHYDSGDLIINGISTKQFKSADWDAYRNSSIGFVFQNYNLIAHQTVLQNVEIAMTLSGVSTTERRERAKRALQDVGLGDKLKKKPNQLSGGQMQRVAIARALVNDPDIILADEPTGALDSQTSIQVMEILKQISKTRLVIMVTHNGELAKQYSTRIVRLLDGEIQEDSNSPIKEELQISNQNGFKKTAMSLFTATSLSFKNLLTKRGRTITTSFAGSIGIIGVALVLALSSGLSSYMASMQTDTLSGYPITISTNVQSFDMTSRNPLSENGDNASYTEFPKEEILHRYNKEENLEKHTNNITEDYIQYIENMKTKLPNAINTISYQYAVNMNILAKSDDSIIPFDTTVPQSRRMGLQSSSYWQEMPDNNEFVLSLYDLIGKDSQLPKNKNEVAIVVDEYNRLDEEVFTRLGITSKEETYDLTDFIGKSMLKVIDNNDYYTNNNGIYTPANPTDYETLYNNDQGIELTVVGILRIKEDAASTYFSEGFVYTTDLTDYVVDNAKNSDITKAQSDSETNVLSGAPFVNEEAKDSTLLSLGVTTVPTGINIYLADFEAKDSIKEYLDKYNVNQKEENKIIYSDMAEAVADMTGTLLNTVSYVLIGFAAISLLVSTIMIGIITYVSVIERTKEIGILRSVGARKKDISRVFNAETLIIGFAAGLLGISISYALTFPINSIISSLVDIDGIASLQPMHAGILILGSMGLTLIAGFFPSRMAAKKDPVEALRTE